MGCGVFSEARQYSHNIFDFRVSWLPFLKCKTGSELTGREYVNRMVYHAFSSDPEALVPEWTFKVSLARSDRVTCAHCRSPQS
jgi:hypothetical protein